MSLRNRIIILVGLVLSLFIAVLCLYRYSHKAAMEPLYRGRMAEKRTLFEKVLELKGKPTESFANDYSYWDEMVGFVDKADKKWAHDNIRTAFPIFGADAAWVLRPDYSLVYSANGLNDEALKYPPWPSDAYARMFARGCFPHFFVKTSRGLMEIRGAPVQPVTDYERKSRPRGYFFAGRLWRKADLAELSSLTGCAVSLYDPGGKLPEDFYDEEIGLITFSRNLPGWDGTPVMLFYARGESPVIREHARLFEQEVILFIIFSFLMLLILSFFIMRWVSNPLKRLSRSLDAEDPAFLERLQKDGSEIGRLARLLSWSIEQKEELVNEIAERKRTEDELKYQKALLECLGEASIDGILVVSPEGRMVHFNQRFVEMWGIPGEVAESRSDEAAIKSVLAKLSDPDGFIEKVNYLYEHKDEHSRDEIGLKDGRTFDRYSGPVLGGDGTFYGRVWFFRDITDRKLAEDMLREHERHLERLARHDALTSLANRVLLNDRLDHALALARRNKELVGVLLLDLDRFKTVNDTLGHQAGDILLQGIAKRLTDCMRESDTVGRLGGDEFCIVLPGMARAEEAAVLAQRVIEAVRPPFYLDGVEIFSTTSIGIAVFPDNGRDTQSLLKNADIALYNAKGCGRNNYQIYNPAMDAAAIERNR